MAWSSPERGGKLHQICCREMISSMSQLCRVFDPSISQDFRLCRSSRGVAASLPIVTWYSALGLALSVVVDPRSGSSGSPLSATPSACPPTPPQLHRCFRLEELTGIRQRVWLRLQYSRHLIGLSFPDHDGYSLPHRPCLRPEQLNCP